MPPCVPLVVPREEFRTSDVKRDTPCQIPLTSWWHTVTLWSMRNVHERRFPTATTELLGELLDRVGSPDDGLWPTASGRWPPMRMSGPLHTQPRGGHGFVRYHVIEYEPGRSVTWKFEDDLDLPGVHRFEVLTDGPAPGLRHTIDARAVGPMRLGWPLAVRWLHDALIEEAFDGVEVGLGTGHAVRRPDPWVRFLLAVGPSATKEDAWARSQA